jgi:hypothetical protein
MGLAVPLIYVPDNIGFPVGVVLCAARAKPLVVMRVEFSKRIWILSVCQCIHDNACC